PTLAEFQMADTDTLRGRRTIVYEFVVKKEFSHQTLKFQENISSAGLETIVGYRVRIWVDRENYRVLRLEDVSVEIPPDRPMTAATSMIAYDWVTVNEAEHLLPSLATLK